MDDNEARLRELVEGERFVMMTTVSLDGELVSRPMTVQEIDGWTFRFIAQESNQLTRECEGGPVSLTVTSGGSHVALRGNGRVTRDVAAKVELWNRLNEAYAGKAEDPDNVIVDVDVEHGEYWDQGNALSRVIGLARAAITRRPADGDHGTVDLT